MRLSIIFLFITASLVMSCKKELQPQESSPVSEAAATTDSATTALANPAAPAPVTQPAMTQPTTTVVPPPAPAAVAKGMNPAHGQPGHRCDIPVGAPLNSKPSKPTSPPQQQNDPNIKVTPAQLNADGTLSPKGATPSSAPAILKDPAATPATAPGMNPAHGQPGHRCDVAVGAPLPKS
ncbi:MAG TPA: hypothetical protein VGB50_05515 [Flavobacterium sp.]|jgi:hypothetical protein